MEEEESPAHGGIETHNLLIMSRVFHHCATTAAQDKATLPCDESVKPKLSWGQRHEMGPRLLLSARDVI